MNIVGSRRSIGRVHNVQFSPKFSPKKNFLSQSCAENTKFRCQRKPHYMQGWRKSGLGTWSLVFRANRSFFRERKSNSLFSLFLQRLTRANSSRHTFQMSDMSKSLSSLFLCKSNGSKSHLLQRARRAMKSNSLFWFGLKKEKSIVKRTNLKRINLKKSESILKRVNQS